MKTVKKLDPRGKIVDVDVREVQMAEECNLEVELEDGTILPMFRDLPDEQDKV